MPLKREPPQLATGAAAPTTASQRLLSLDDRGAIAGLMLAVTEILHAHIGSDAAVGRDLCRRLEERWLFALQVQWKGGGNGMQRALRALLIEARTATSNASAQAERGSETVQ